MKVKANKKFNNVNPQAIPCSVADRKALKKGQSVDVDDIWEIPVVSETRKISNASTGTISLSRKGKIL